MVSPRRVNILGVGVNALSMPDALRWTESFLAQDEPGYVCVTGVHGIIEAQDDSTFRSILNRSALTTPDGMPTVWLGKARGFSGMDRVYGPDYMRAVCELSVQRGYRHFFYGGNEGVAEQLKATLEAEIPGLLVAGTYTPPFRPLTASEEIELRERIAESRADILWVGLSTPKQECFMAAQVGRLPVKLMVGVGAAFDLLSGIQQDAPALVKRMGMQWFYRLVQEPKRLWRRYCSIVPRFLVLVALESLGLRRYSLE